MKRSAWVFIGGLAAVVLGGAVFAYLVLFEQEKPSVQILPEAKVVGKSLVLKVQDRKSGVAELRVDVIQQGKTVSLLDEKFPKKTPSVEKTLSLRPLPQGLKDGEAQVRVSAKDHSWNWGNPVSLEKAVVIDTAPPQISVLGTLHYATQGGAGLVTYRVSEEVAATGVQVGESFFPGYPAGPGRHAAFFPIPRDGAAQTAFSVVAQDFAENRAQAGFRLILKAKTFRKDKIRITDSLLQTLTPYFTAMDPGLKGTPLEIFLSVNGKQREADHREVEKLCKETSPKTLWSGPFLRLPNAKPMAGFADHRTYEYNGQEVDRQVHLGVDLASVNQAPVPSANSGRVVFAGPLGIYGNTVLVDHGAGLFSMYSHLSRMETEAKREVRKGDVIGYTGLTGMAGGDHLHFSMLIHGVFVNPIEWWDEHWIKDNVELKMKWLEGEAVQARPAPKASPEPAAKPKTRKPAGKPGKK